MQDSEEEIYAYNTFPQKWNSLDTLLVISFLMLFVPREEWTGDIGEFCNNHWTSVFGAVTVAKVASFNYFLKDGIQKYMPAIIGAGASVAVEAGQELTGQAFGPGDIHDVYSALGAGVAVALACYRQK